MNDRGPPGEYGPRGLADFALAPLAEDFQEIANAINNLGRATPAPCADSTSRGPRLDSLTRRYPVGVLGRRAVAGHRPGVAVVE